MNKRTGILGILSLAFAALAPATTITWDLTTPQGDLGTSHTYTSNTGGINITAYGFSSASHNDAQLYGKKIAPDDLGLGMDLYNDPSHEITGSAFVELDLTNLIAAHATDLMFSMSSVTYPDAWRTLGTSTFGSLGTTTACNPACPAGSDEVKRTIYPNFPKYLNFQATAGTFLIGTLSADIPSTVSSVPEPASLALMGMGLLGLGAVGRRFKQSR